MHISNFHPASDPCTASLRQGVGLGTGNSEQARADEGQRVVFGTTPEGCSISRDMRSESEIASVLCCFPNFSFCFCFFFVVVCSPLSRFYEDYALMITQ